ncbi:TIGR03086 family metal-binding protein [Mycolicibacter icosiumassiliensis]|uniref:TIGR03086 family metal-binding protein n=1 Tax=Mycolicibacter icosiumassiliensis TaxID=1792835 RepID=UPI00082BF905|nr:TIGR03086 family metal-binding protein [Mycolicibacter icosiumassiliensis]
MLDTVMLDSTDLDALDRATQSFSHVLVSLDTDACDRPTACGDWTIKDVANHVCGGALRYAHYLRGGMPEEIVWTRTADNIGGDPRAAHDRLSAELRTLFAQPGAGLIRAHHPMQTVSGGALLRMRVAELAVHGWDITSTLDPTSMIDNDLAIYILDRGASILQAQRDRGYFAEVEPANPDAAAPARLLALTGRSQP